ncbi:LamG-like jellyroll fold domain-containing protein [Dyella sp. 2RAB6]|uniref:LamG-like jellyroll fold domain-containing protein n=1 Tax=Dyella sp. 2RAB6 TaxID=3232992 RepID=UPI003F90EFB2
MKQTNPPVLVPQIDADAHDHIDDNSRRRFIGGLGAGALLLGLGVGVGESRARSLPPSGSAPAGSPLITGRFTHPGLLVNEDDFTRIRNKLKNGEQPWTKWWQTLCASSNTSLAGKPNPQPAVYRHNGTKWALYRDIERAFCCALRWKISNDDTYAKLAVETLDAWSETLKFIGTNPPGVTEGDDHTGYLMCGMQGHQFANAAEIMRTYTGWSAQGVARFQDMLRNVFAAPISKGLHGHLTDGGLWSFANWDYAALVGTLAIGVFCDDIDLYRQAIEYYTGNNHGDVHTQFGNGMAMHSVYFMHPGYLGQWQESGRDQGHSTLGMSLGGDLLEMAWKQGDDLYSAFNNRFLAGAEYVAKSNVLDKNGKQYVMPFARQSSPIGLFTAAANQAGPSLRCCWETIYNHYVNRMGIDAPYIAQMVRDAEFRNQNGGDDVVYSTLWSRRDDYAGPLRAPFGVSGFCSEGKVTLSWWGGKDTLSYMVKRSNSVSGPFSVIGSVAADETRTFSDMPGQGVWYYQIQASNGINLVSRPARVAAPGELRCSMDLADGGGNTAVGWVTSPDGEWVRGDGTLMNGASWGAGRLPGSAALLLDGKQSYVQLPAGMITDVADFTMSMWTFANAPLHWNTCLLFIGLDGGRCMFLAPLAGRNGGRLRFAITGSGVNDEQVVEADQALPFRRWVHVAVTLGGGTAKIYIDGRLAGRDDSFELSPRQLIDQKRLLGWDGGHASFDGRIQDFRFYSMALSDAQIAALAK